MVIQLAPAQPHFILSSLSPDRAQRLLAPWIVLTLLFAFFITAGPLSTVQFARIEAFAPAHAAPMFIVDLITAALPFAQFSILRSFALLAIAIGYLFTALVVIPSMLAFSGVFAPSGLRHRTGTPSVANTFYGALVFQSL
jgi:hypothetical protein